MEVQSEEHPAAVAASLTDQRFGKLLVVARQLNDLKVRIRVATDYLGSEASLGDKEEIRYAREQLVKDLERNQEEAEGLLPVVSEMVGQYQERLETLNMARKLHHGLARIEQLAGSMDSSRAFEMSAGEETAKIQQMESLVAALGTLEEDVNSRREFVSCPRCSAKSVSYSVMPSDTGYSLYRCNACSNTWNITRFSLKIG